MVRRLFLHLLALYGHWGWWIRCKVLFDELTEAHYFYGPLVNNPYAPSHYAGGTDELWVHFSKVMTGACGLVGK